MTIEEKLMIFWVLCAMVISFFMSHFFDFDLLAVDHLVAPGLSSVPAMAHSIAAFL